MATFRRALTQGATYFFTVNTHQRQALLTEPHVYRALKENVLSVMRDYPFTIEARRPPGPSALHLDVTGRRCGIQPTLEHHQAPGKPAGTGAYRAKHQRVAPQAPRTGPLATAFLGTPDQEWRRFRTAC